MTDLYPRNTTKSVDEADGFLKEPLRIPIIPKSGHRSLLRRLFELRTFYASIVCCVVRGHYGIVIVHFCGVITMTIVTLFDIDGIYGNHRQGSSCEDV